MDVLFTIIIVSSYLTILLWLYYRQRESKLAEAEEKARRWKQTEDWKMRERDRGEGGGTKKRERKAENDKYKIWRKPGQSKGQS